MNSTTCPMCGFNFDPKSRSACPSCPLHKGCSLVCCPACGYTTPDPSQSGLVNWFTRFRRRRRAGPKGGRKGNTLKHMLPGTEGKVCEFRGMDRRHIEMLQAFGLCPGQWVRIIQRIPEIVVEVGNTELALEEDLAEKVIIEH